MPQCETRHGVYRCSHEKGHKDQHGHATECSFQMPEFRAVSTAEYLVMKRALLAHRAEIVRLRHVEEAARGLLMVPPGTDRFEERRGVLIHALEGV